jgi:hypothetical protein
VIGSATARARCAWNGILSPLRTRRTREEGEEEEEESDEKEKERAKGKWKKEHGSGHTCKALPPYSTLLSPPHPPQKNLCTYYCDHICKNIIYTLEKKREKGLALKKTKVGKEEGIFFSFTPLKLKFKKKNLWKIEIIITPKQKFTSEFWKRPSQTIVSIIRPNQAPPKKSHPTPNPPQTKYLPHLQKARKKRKKTPTYSTIKFKKLRIEPKKAPPQYGERTYHRVQPV